MVIRQTIHHFSHHRGQLIVYLRLFVFRVRAGWTRS
jgi:uncharacterized damage-inducible protein DinB